MFDDRTRVGIQRLKSEEENLAFQAQKTSVPQGGRPTINLIE